MKNKIYIIEIEMSGWFYYYGVNKDYLPELVMMSSSPLDKYALMSKNFKGFSSLAAAQLVIDEGVYFGANNDNAKIIEVDL